MSAAEEMRRRARQHGMAAEYEEQAVATALADLLDALRRTEGVLQDVDVWNAYEALDAAIDRSGT